MEEPYTSFIQTSGNEQHFPLWTAQDQCIGFMWNHQHIVSSLNEPSTKSGFRCNQTTAKFAANLYADVADSCCVEN